MTETTLDGMLGAVEEIAPILREHRTANEHQHHLMEPVVDAMTGVGLYRLWIPKAYGGIEADPVTGFQVLEAVACVDSAAAWNLGLSIGAAPFANLFPNGVDEFFSAPKGILAGAFNPPGKAFAVDGRYRVTSRTPFVSGCQNAEWIVGPTMIVDGNDVRRTESGAPEMLAFFYPSSDAEIIDHWDTLGMCGTGSHDVALHDVFVPEHRTGPLMPWAASPKGLEGPLYRYSIWPAVAALAPVAFGIARSAIGDLVDLATTKTPAYTPSPLCERAVAQAQVAEAQAKLGAARAYLHESFREFWEEAEQGHALPQTQKDKIQLASTYGVQTAAEAVELVHKASGTSGMRRERDFERHFRDIHSITQHAFTSAGRYQSVGRSKFGLASDWPFAAF